MFMFMFNQTLLDTRYSKTAKEDTYYTHGKTIETQVEALDLQKSTTLDLGEVQLLPAALWVWQDLLKSNTGSRVKYEYECEYEYGK